jgi:hypothetical protein
MLPSGSATHGMLSSSRPPCARVHLRPCCAVVRRPPHVILIAVTIPAHQDDAAIRERNGAVIVSCRPRCIGGHLLPCRAAIRRSPHIILEGAIIPPHHYDAAVRKRHAGVSVSSRPPGTRCHLCPGGRTILVTEIPRPAGGILRRQIRELHRERFGAKVSFAVKFASAVLLSHRNVSCLPHGVCFRRRWMPAALHDRTPACIRVRRVLCRRAAVVSPDVILFGTHRIAAHQTCCRPEAPRWNACSYRTRYSAVICAMLRRVSRPHKSFFQESYRPSG